MTDFYESTPVVDPPAIEVGGSARHVGTSIAGLSTRLREQPRQTAVSVPGFERGDRRILHPHREMGGAVVVPGGARHGRAAGGEVRSDGAEERIERGVRHVAVARGRAAAGGIVQVRDAGRPRAAEPGVVPGPFADREVCARVRATVGDDGGAVVGRSGGVSTVRDDHLVGGSVVRGGVPAVRGGDGRRSPLGGVAARGQEAAEKSEEARERRHGLHGLVPPSVVLVSSTV